MNSFDSSEATLAGITQASRKTDNETGRQEEKISALSSKNQLPHP
jgi:hypothetical protein